MPHEHGFWEMTLAFAMVAGMIALATSLGVGRVLDRYFPIQNGPDGRKRERRREKWISLLSSIAGVISAVLLFF